jgi:hypothetical protein
MGVNLTFRFRLLREYEEGYQTERAVVFDETTSSGFVPLWEAIGVYDSLYNSDGQYARDISRTLAYGLDRLHGDASLNRLAPAAQSVSYSDATHFLENVLRACTIHPAARIETS